MGERPDGWLPGQEAHRPWLCPEQRCTPLLNLKDGDYRDIRVAEPGQSFFCWGRMAEPVTFVYDGVEHTNDCNACSYTALKGLVRFQENPLDWDALSTYYAMAKKRALAFDPTAIQEPDAARSTER